MLRIGRIDYANCTPIFKVLEDLKPRVDYQLVGGVPAQLNTMLSKGLVDVCPSSSIEYALHPEQYLILPHLSISSIGKVGSVLLFSRIPIDKLDGRNILLSSESATSVNLLRILLEKRFGLTCSYKVHAGSLESALQDAPALLLIGDEALRESIEASDLLVYDLGLLWFEWTGLPFVYALWLCRREVAEDHYEEVSDLAGYLVASKICARNDLQSIAEGAPEVVWMGAARLVSYWRENISYDLDGKHVDGLNLFYQYCLELGLLTAEPKLHFLTEFSQKEI